MHANFEEMPRQNKNEKWYYKLRSSYRLVIFNDKTFEERFSFRLTRMNVIITFLSLGIIFITITFFIIAYTPIRTYIPGYPTVDQKKELYKLNLMADSMLNSIKQKDLYIKNIKNIFENDESLYTEAVEPVANSRLDTSQIVKSKEDSMLRAEFESSEIYNLYFTEPVQDIESARTSIRSFNFFKPLTGIITSPFNQSEKHFGTDIVTAHNETIMSTLDGTVIYANWTLETGNVIAIQHKSNLISVYKHCSVLLKEEGEQAKAGEPIAITGESGEYATGPHLHFELWYNGSPVNPEEYIIFN